MSGLLRAGVLLTAVLLNGCALLVPPSTTPDEAAWTARQAELAQVEQWTVQARMATTLLGWSGSLNWQQDGEHLRLNVTGPLGIGGFQAQGTLHYVDVVTADQQRLVGDPELLFEQVVGWHFPLRGMRYWALGLPVPGLPATVNVDGEGRLAEMQQDGWTLQVSEYRQYAERQLPRRLRLDRGELTIRIVIDQWQLPERT